MTRIYVLLSASLAILTLAACSEPPPGPKAETGQTAPTSAPAESAAAVAAQPAPYAQGAILVNAPSSVPAPGAPASDSPVAQAIDKAAWTDAAASPQARRDALIRAQVLLARARFSPGVIDGRDGGNLQNALAAFEEAHGLPADGKLSADAWAALAADAGPVMADYVITAQDVAGPFVAKIPTDYAEMAKLDRLGFTSPAEALSEKFHMDEALLRALNPGADFAAAGTTILVAALGPDKLAAPVARIEVDKARRQVRAYGEGDRLLAVYPATVGSAERPAPSGDWAVRTLAPNPTFTYDPSRLTYGKASQGKLTIKAGPNNPVGSTWIDLTKDTFGIHGTPDPRLVGKAASHGCVRLTNWDVRQLGAAVQKGTKVQFVGVERATVAKT